MGPRAVTHPFYLRHLLVLYVLLNVVGQSLSQTQRWKGLAWLAPLRNAAFVPKLSFVAILCLSFLPLLMARSHVIGSISPLHYLPPRESDLTHKLEKLCTYGFTMGRSHLPLTSVNDKCKHWPSHSLNKMSFVYLKTYSKCAPGDILGGILNLRVEEGSWKNQRIWMLLVTAQFT